MKLEKVDDGYKEKIFVHKHLYHCRRR
jgi:hypothetical protein